jgi:hypothetical protein
MSESPSVSKRSRSPLAERETLFVAAILRSRLCLRCASIRSDIVENVLAAVIHRLQRHVYIRDTVDECEDCGRRTVVYRVS